MLTLNEAEAQGLRIGRLEFPKKNDVELSEMVNTKPNLTLEIA